jgi:hypothetical protein
VATARARSVSSFIGILLLAVIGTAVFAGGAGYAAGANNLAGQFSVDQTQFVDGLVYGTQIKTEWVEQNPDKQATSNDFQVYFTQRCAGKFFPALPVAMKGCLAAQQPRPPEGYQYP